MNIQKIKITNVESSQPVKINNAQTITMLIPIDDIPIENSPNAVSSGGVYTRLEYLDNKIDSRIPFVTFEIKNGYLLMNEANNKEITFELDDYGNLIVVI